ncbi:MAG: transglutaminase-like cysteine peptidase [Pseudomonadota bacterium]
MLFVACLFALWSPLPEALGFDFDRLRAALLERFDTTRLPLLDRWQQTLTIASTLPEAEKLIYINDFFNNNFYFYDDVKVWQQNDYWATPMELIGRGEGDCEDMAIAKYYSLKEVGVATEKLRMVYVKAAVHADAGPTTLAHMVLAYYPTPNAEPLVLDNLDVQIKSASQRGDLQPIFSFNSDAVWSGVAANSTRKEGTGQLTRWQDLVQRARTEGLE